MQQLPNIHGGSETDALQQELARCVRFLNLGGTFAVSDILADPAVAAILAEIEALAVPQARAA